MRGRGARAAGEPGEDGRDGDRRDVKGPISRNATLQLVSDGSQIWFVPYTVSGGGRWGHYGGTRWGHPANSRWQRVDHPESKLASEGESAPSAVTGDPNNSFERRASPSNSQACLCEAKQELKQPTGSEENNHEIPEDFA